MPPKNQRALRRGGFRPAGAVAAVIVLGFAAAYLSGGESRARAQGRPHRAAPMGSISGTVTGPDGKPAAGARVMAQTSDGRSPRTTKTDEKGRFHIGHLREGPYDLRARSGETWSEWKRDVRVRANQTSSVTLHIPAGEGKKPAAKNVDDISQTNAAL